MNSVTNVPSYQGHSWVGGALPIHAQAWLRSEIEREHEPGVYDDEATREAVDAYLTGRPWVWPGKRVYLFCDIHADAEAFVRSLVASGGVAKTGAADADFELTDEGRSATFLIAGDCLDKGPSNLRLLRSVKRLIDIGAAVLILAGNHDVRAMVGMRCAGERDPRLAHLFVRMGKKAIPLFREIYDEYLAHQPLEESAASNARTHQRLFPSPSWYLVFPQAVAGVVSPKKIDLELVRIREKAEDMELGCADVGLSLTKVDAVIAKFHDLFLTPGGEFAWLYERMQLAHRVGSVLFIHAGVDDCLAERLRQTGLDGINAWFQQLMRDDLFELYHGAAGNGFRTKYRDTDWPLTARGVRDLHDCGVYAVVHGHRNILNGQRMIFRQGMLNFECDGSIDQNTRALHDLDQAGAAVTIFQPDGRVLAISTDFPTAKVFDAARRTLLTIPQDHVLTTQGHPMNDTNETNTNEDSDMTRQRSEDGKISFDAHMTRDEAVTYFEAIVKGLRSGTVTFRRSDEELVLEVGSHLDIEVKASRKGKKQKVEIELGWRTEKASDLEID